MGIYIKELSPIEGSVGNQMMTMLIERSFGKSVYFEIFEDNHNWKIYWNYEIRPAEFLPVMKQYVKPGMTLSDAIQDETIQKKIKELSHTFSKDLGEEEVALIKSIIVQGFPEISRRKPRGLDGHSYIFTIGGDDKEYECWCVIPKEWSNIRVLIDLLVDIADLTDNYRISGIN